LPGAELKHFTINQNTNKEASEAWDYWKSKGVNISDRICQLIIQARMQEKQLELADKKKQDEERQLQEEQHRQLRCDQLEAEEQIRQQIEAQIIKEVEENPTLKEHLDKKQEELTNLILQDDIAAVAERIDYLPLSEIERIRRSSDVQEASAIARQKVLEEYSKEQLVKQKQMDSLGTLFLSSP
jgi:hypothetical protein